ncbi:MAG: transporter [Gemmatimonadota bacterium]
MRSRRTMLRTLAGGATLTFSLLVPGARPAGAQVASPLQTGHYVPGVMNLRDYAATAPGLYAVWYNWFVSSGTYVDRNGDELTSLDLSGFATVPSLFWASTFTFLGGARYLAAVAPNWMTSSFTFVVEPGGPGSGPSDGEVVEGSVSGLSDLFVAPVGLSWALGQFDATFFYGFTAPTGRYTTGADDNIGLGFWTHQFQGFGYFFPNPSQATALMLGLTYELNSEIEDVAVNPGNRLSLEYGVSHYPTGWLELGVQGAHNWQVTDDSGSDVIWDPSYHDQKSTLLFSAGFWPWAGRLYVAAKYGFDYGVRQRFKNNNLMLNLIWVTNALDGM